MNTTSKACVLAEAWLNGPSVIFILNIFKQTVTIYIGIPVVIVGLMTSIISFVMFTIDRNTPLTTRILLMTVATTDIMFLPLASINAIAYALCNRKCREQSSINVLLLVSMVRLFGNIVEMIRNWVMVIIGMERFLLICHPLRSKRLWTRKRVVYLIIATAVLSTIVRIPSIIDNVIYAHRNLSYAHLTKILSNIHVLTDTLFLTIMPLGFLSVFGVRIYACLRKSKQLRTQNSFIIKSHHFNCQRQLRVNQVILAALGAFWIFMMPSLPLIVLQLRTWNASMTTCSIQYATYTLAYITTLGTLFNSSANFFVYVLYSRRYRKLLLKMLSCQKGISPHQRILNVSSKQSEQL